MITLKHKQAWAANHGVGIDMPRAFTLIELLVVITIILIISAAALPTVLPALSHRQVSEAGRILQGGLAGARDAAIRNNAPAGIRLLPDPAFPVQWITDTKNTSFYGQIDPTQPLASNRFIPIEQPPDYNTGMVSIYPPVIYSSISYLPTMHSGSNILILEQSYYSTVNGTNVQNEPTSWNWNLRVGDKIQIGNAGPFYTVVGPMEIGPVAANGNQGGNTELFVNYSSYPKRLVYDSTTNSATATAISVDYLYLVNGVDDNANGLVDDGWNGVVSTVTEGTTTYQTFEAETWIGSLAHSTSTNDASFANATNVSYNVTRRPAPTSRGRETPLPSNVVIDLTTWNSNLFAYQERSRLPVNQFTGTVDIIINPDGTVRQSTQYSAPVSVGMASAFDHFWIAERSDVVLPTLPSTYTAPVSSAPYLPIALPEGATASSFGYSLLKGEYRLLTLFTRTGQISSDENMVFGDPTTKTALLPYSPNNPFLETQQGITGGF